MSDQQTWVEALNINPESLSEWSSQAPEGTPLLVYCLEQGHVPLEDYLQWAKEQFGIPVLHANYFQQAFDPTFLENARQQGDWHPWCYPVEQWDGVTLVACVEPPSSPDSPDVRYVLADPRLLREAWGGTSPSIAAADLPPLPTTEAELPAGMTTETKPFTLNLDEVTFNLGSITEVNSIESNAAEPEMPPPPQYALPEMPPAPLMVETPPAPATKAPELKIVPSAPKKATPIPASAADESGSIKALFAALRERYSSALIMKSSDQSARPYQWDESVQPLDGTDKAVVNLSFPTFLRIVAKTNLPYHGYLIDSPAHREFFSALGLPALPLCVTAVPVRFENRLWGMVVAFGGEENQKIDSLNYVQEHTDQLIHAIGAVWSKAG